MTIVPDDKDWTWVLGEPCPECGVEAAAIDLAGVGDLTRTCGVRFAAVLTRRSDADVRRRPDPATWSPLEYACHVRDVFRTYDARLARMLTEDDPLFQNWDQDATAVEDRYGEQDPATVAAELRAAAALLGEAFDTVAGDQWERPGRRSDGASFTVASFARYFVHDPLHHLHDVGEPLPSLS
jgi:hypothetical protein